MDIGEEYLKNEPLENNYTSLKKNLLININILKHASNFLKRSIDSKIKFDYEAENIFIIDGWIISQTEAKQCALKFLNQS